MEENEIDMTSLKSDIPWIKCCILPYIYDTGGNITIIMWLMKNQIF